MTKSHEIAASNSDDSPTRSSDGAGVRATDLVPVGETAAAARWEAGPETELRVRRAAVADARTIAEIGVKGWQAAYRGILPGDFLDDLSVASREIAWRSLLESDLEDMTPAWIVERDDGPVGFASGGPPRDEDVPLPAAEVYALYVLPQVWRRGVGRALLTAAIKHWRSRGAETLTLWVLEDNARGRAFYEAMGWLPDGSRQPLEMGGFSVTEIRYRLPAPDWAHLAKP
jgi:GNAT superfamily N-acetyltransferase